jgi:ABC-type uncharacterized transport system fused permease/ATPase subunit
MDVALEETCFRALLEPSVEMYSSREEGIRRTTLVSVAHRPSALKYHQRHLHFDNDGKWRIRLIHRGHRY